MRSHAVHQVGGVRDRGQQRETGKHGPHVVVAGLDSRNSRNVGEHLLMPLSTFHEATVVRVGTHKPTWVRTANPRVVVVNGRPPFVSRQSNQVASHPSSIGFQLEINNIFCCCLFATHKSTKFYTDLYYVYLGNLTTDDVVESSDSLVNVDPSELLDHSF